MKPYILRATIVTHFQSMAINCPSSKQNQLPLSNPTILCLFCRGTARDCPGFSIHRVCQCIGPWFHRSCPWFHRKVAGRKKGVMGTNDVNRILHQS